MGRIMRYRWTFAALAVVVVVAANAWWSWQREAPRFLPADTSAFVAIFASPPADDSPQTRHELDELLALQRQRSDLDAEAARTDRRKDIDRFYAALGLDVAHPPPLPLLEELMNDVERDVGRYVRAPKKHFSRHRPYVLETRLKPCIGNVEDDSSYPSGHATYGYVVAYLLADMVPERRMQLEARATEYARQRMVCGVHFPGDLSAGKYGARWLHEAFAVNPSYVTAAARATRELRAALHLAQTSAASNPAPG